MRPQSIFATSRTDIVGQSHLKCEIAKRMLTLAISEPTSPTQFHGHGFLSSDLLNYKRAR